MKGRIKHLTLVYKPTSSSVSSPARLFRSISAFLRTTWAYRLPTPCGVKCTAWRLENFQQLHWHCKQNCCQFKSPTLMAVMANAILRLPSMFVLRTRRMCWNFSGITSDWEKTDRHRVRHTAPYPPTQNSVKVSFIDFEVSRVSRPNCSLIQ